jgi:hypothetical protein
VRGHRRRLGAAAATYAVAGPRAGRRAGRWASSGAPPMLTAPMTGLVPEVGDKLTNEAHLAVRRSMGPSYRRGRREELVRGREDISRVRQRVMLRWRAI